MNIVENNLSAINLMDIYESLAKALNVTSSDIEEFIKAQTYRVKKDGYHWDYKKIVIDDILEYFDLDIQDIIINSITVSHVAAILDTNSYYEFGLLSLDELFSTDNSFIRFLKEFGVTFKRENDVFKLYINDQIQSTKYTTHRATKDKCINGFMFESNVEKDSNIDHLLRAPELVIHIGRELLFTEQLVREWESRSVPSVITFKVMIDEIDGSTFKDDQQAKSKEEIMVYFLISYFEFLLFEKTGYRNDNHMVYLKEETNIDANRIVQIRKL